MMRYSVCASLVCAGLVSAISTTAIAQDAEPVAKPTNLHTIDAKLSPEPSSTRRLTARQIRRSISAATGIPQEFVKFPLPGEPDFNRVLKETGQTSSVFMNALIDGAGTVCASFYDFNTKEPKERRFWDREGVLEDDLHRVIQSFWMVPIPKMDPRFQALAKTIRTARTPRDGWVAACTALIASPEFIFY